MGYSSKIVSAGVAVSLAVFAPIVPASAEESFDAVSHEAVVADSTGLQDEAASAEIVASDEASFVYDKADFYNDGGQWDEESPDIALLESGRSAYSVYPMYLSDEMKYFAKYESSRNYDQGFGSGDGYHALGFYQFDHRYGLKAFLLACYAYNPSRYVMFKQFASISDSDFRKNDAIRRDGRFTDLGNDLNAAWHAAYAANPAEFSALQDGWAYRNYYVPAESYLRSRGIDISNRADCVKGLCWGMSNLFGTTGWRKFVGGISDGYDWNGIYHWPYENYNWPGCGLSSTMSDREFVTVLCNYVVNNVAIFYKGQPQYHRGWQNRYCNELRDCLSYLGPEQQKDGWVQVGREWKYRIGGEYVVDSWRFVGGAWYWFDASGIAARDTMKMIDGALYRFGPSCDMLSGTWYDNGGEWYYFGASGAAATGFQEIDGERYCLDAFSHRMLVGLQKVNGSWYYFNELHDGSFGAMQTGWQQVDGVKRFFSDSGAMKTGWILDRGNRYYLGDDGAMRTGWEFVSDAWYFLEADGAAATGMAALDGSLYCFDDMGAMQTGWVFDDERWYCFESSGSASSGWSFVDGEWYYFDPRSHVMASGLCDIEGVRYYLNSNHDGSFGAMRTGWQWTGDAWRFFQGSGAMRTGWYFEDGSWYHLGENGVMSRWWNKIDGVWYYFNASGVMQTRCWQGDYYLKSDGSMATDMRIGRYYVGSDGKWIPGK